MVDICTHDSRVGGLRDLDHRQQRVPLLRSLGDSGIGDGELVRVSFCSRNIGITLPRLPTTLPYRAQLKRVSRAPEYAFACTNIFLCAQFGCAVEVNRVHGLVGTQRQYPFHALIDRGRVTSHCGRP